MEQYINDRMKIRRVKDNEIASLRNIFMEIRQNEFPWEARIHPLDFDTYTMDEVIYVAVIDDAISGFISIWEPDFFVHHLFVDRQARNCGVGYALLKYAKDQYKQTLTLKCVQENQQAYQFYLHHGWTVVEKVDHVEIPYFLMKWL